MKRRSFFQKIGIGAAAIMAAPKIIEAIPFKEEPVNDLNKPLVDNGFYRKTKEVSSGYVIFAVRVTSAPHHLGGGVYEIGLSEELRVGTNIIIPSSHIVSKHGRPCSCLVTEKCMSGKFKIALYDVTERISVIPVGTILAVGGSCYSTPASEPSWMSTETLLNM
jgi:hypothetical protein